MWDMAWIADPSAWVGLGTLIVLEVVLGIDNLVFISVLASRLPGAQKRQAFFTGLGLALLIRLALLGAVAWIVGLTEPLFTIWGRNFSWRDIILLLGGVFLLFKGTMELHERLEGGVMGGGEDGGSKAVFWQVIAQILVLDAVFSLDSIITSVGMVPHVPVMMIAVVVAMIVMVAAAGPLTAFVERHPTVIILCLGFLLMIGVSLVTDGMGFHIPKGYLYAAIAFSIFVEGANHLALRNRRKRISMRDMRESTARAVLANSGQANACTGREGIENCRETQRLVAEAVGVQPHEIVPLSTGVIGAQLKMDLWRAAVPALARSLGTQDAEGFTRAFMTTDAFPKFVTRQVRLSGGEVRLAGMAKGAGMICPNMATMLSVVLTDAAKRYIIDSAYDPAFGARPLRRFVQHSVETLISRKIIADQVEPGSRITVDCRDGKLTVDTREVLTGEVIDG